MVNIVPFAQEHLPAITEIYGHYVQTSAITFDLKAPSEQAMGQKLSGIRNTGYPIFVAYDEVGAVQGFSYASPYRPKKAYQHSAEVTVYVAPEAHGQGYGSALLKALMEHLQSEPKYHLAIAIIADDAKASIGLHKKHGFKEIGYIAQVGRKFDRWHGTTILTKSLHVASA